ncbi:MAG: hypothetical protein OHK0015_33930 [Chloroflexi bacterium OHK40]
MVAPEASVATGRSTRDRRATPSAEWFEGGQPAWSDVWFTALGRTSGSPPIYAGQAAKPPLREQRV